MRPEIRGYRPAKTARVFIAPLVLVLVLTACQRSPEPTTPMATRTTIPSRAPLPTSTPSVPASSTPSPLPTASPRPSITASPSATPGISPAALAYLDRALQIMEQYSINRQQIQWDRLKSRVLLRAGNAATPTDTYPAIEFALSSLGDSHSFFLDPQAAADLMSGAMMQDLPAPEGKLLDNGLAYLNIPMFAGSAEAGKAYATHLQQILRALDASTPCGWIIDLRSNGGGDMWPMLAGVGPLLGDSLAGAFVDPDGQQVTWFYENGQAREGDDVQIQIDPGSVYTLTPPLPPVAVLVGQGTLSSGEALLVAFRGRPFSRSFGRETGGLTTANEMFSLSDGARLYLTVSSFADRTGQVYGGIISPDEYISQTGADDDPVLEKASAWLLEQANCAKP